MARAAAGANSGKNGRLERTEARGGRAGWHDGLHISLLSVRSIFAFLVKLSSVAGCFPSIS